MNSALALSACLAVAATLAPAPAYSVVFLPPTSITLGNSYNDAQGIDTGDLNHDGRPDFVVVDGSSAVLDVIVSQPGGGYAPVVRIPTPNGPLHVVLADLNSDTHLDAITANRTASSISVFLGDGIGGFQPRMDFPTPTGSSRIAVGDVTGDGKLDVVGAADLRVDVLAGNGAGQLAAPVSTVLGTSFSASQVWAIALGDLDEDGDLDVVTNYNGPLVELRNSGNATFTRQDFGSNIGARALTVADVTGDGHRDVVATSDFQYGIIVFAGNGGGGLTQNPVLITDLGPCSESVVDFDRDGQLDVVVANLTRNTISVLMGTGFGLGTSTQFATSASPTAVCAADVNGDGASDIVETGLYGLVLFRLQSTISPPPPPPGPYDVWHEEAPLGKIASHEAVYDPTRQCLWVFGGTRKDGGVRNEVWAFDFASGVTVERELIVTGTKPSPRNGHTLILDTVGDRLIVFGSSSGGNDVWALHLADPASWERLLPTGPLPSVRSGMVSVYDAPRNRMLLFGGTTSAVDLNDVWALSLGPTPAWSHIVPTGSLPAPRHGASAVYDPIGDRLVIVGGTQGAYPATVITLGDVWALSLSTQAWSQLSSSGVDATGARVVMDPVRNRLVLCAGGPVMTCVGNQTMQFDLSSHGWSTLATGGPAGRVGHIAVYDPVQDRLIVHAGTEPGCAQNYYFWYQDVLALSFATLTWSDVTPVVTRPPVRSRALMAYIPARNEAMVVGGMPDGHFGAATDVWKLDLSGAPTWSSVVPLAAPPVSGFSGSSVVYDPVRDRMLLFGGNSTGAGGPSTALSCLALGSSPAWQSLAVSGSPPPQRGFHTAIYDPVGDRMIVFGGNTGSGSDGLVYDDLWQLTLNEPMTWSQLFPTGTRPGPRYRHGAVYDPVRQRMLVTLGRIPGGITSETWALSLTGPLQWTQILPDGVPPAVTSRDIPPIYDSARDRLVYFDGVGTTFELNLAGTPTWTPLPFPSSPPNRVAAATIYDVAGDRMIAYGGEGSSERFTCSFCSPMSATSDLWIMPFPPAPTSVEPGLGRSGTTALLAYPNPSRSETTLEFVVPTRSAGSVRVHDVTGRLVRELANGPLAAGRHQLHWDGRDAQGGIVTPGLYFVRARLGPVEYRRMVVRVR
jgi:FG-GAP-like repeat/FlgD Ig-like domain/Galactose oxidase, central domain/Kelch motif